MRTDWTIKINYKHEVIPYCTFTDGTVVGGGKIDGVSGQYVVFSTDDWNTVTRKFSIPVGSARITAIYPVNDNTLLVGTNSGRVYRSIAPFNTCTEVLKMTGTLGYPWTWSFTSKGNLVFTSEYGMKDISPEANARRVYKSTDGGVTWTQNYIIPHTNNAHVHKILLDPFTDILWVTNGDGASVRGVTKLIPPDYTQAEIVFTSIQPTGGIAFPDFIIWIQDNAPYGVYKHTKSTNSLELILDLTKDFPEYADTGFEGLIYNPDEKCIYYGTNPSVNKTKTTGVFRSLYPFNQWELIAAYPNVNDIYKGINHFAKCKNGIILGQMTLPSGNRSFIMRDKLKNLRK